MGGCLGGAKVGDEEFKEGSGKDISKGPIKERGCTDVLCCVLFIVHFFVFFAIVFMGMADGNPEKLYRPRDFAGDYCGVEEQWNNGRNLKDHEKLLQMMNVSTTIEEVVNRFVCSNVAYQELQTLMTAAELIKYECDCCITPCTTCSGSGKHEVITSSGALQSSISTSMADYTSASNAASLWSGGLDGILSEAAKYFVMSCVKSCGSVGEPATRSYTYAPDPDSKLSLAWQKLQSGGSANIKATMASSFTFGALSLSECAYPEQYCVPFPGLEFTEAAAGYCAFQVASAVTERVGSTFESLGASVAAESVTENLGSAVGDVLVSLDAFVVVSILAFVCGFVFLVLLRFFIGIVVWLSIFLVLILLLVTGLVVFIKSSQCKDSDFTSSATSTAVATGSAAQGAASGVASGSTVSEAYTGNGQDYRGIQSRTSQGTTCQEWNTQTPHNQVYPSAYPDDGLTNNYCRNPGGLATGIWCFTTDSEVRWDLCTPVGQIKPDCVNGYAIDNETFRDVLEVIAYIIWACAGLYVVAIVCLQSRIRLAIALNKAAAQFIYTHRTIVFVPVVQVFCGILWCLLWAFLAAFLLSQVPDTYVPKDYFETWAAANSKCTDQWPTGGVWKYAGDLTKTDDPCSGSFGVAPDTPKCWRCFPPRYAFDYRVWFAFFTFLWNNAFIIAVGQCIIAGAVGVWFFTPHNDKGSNGPIRASLYNTFVYHTGSLAFGAFILAVVQFIRYFMKYLEKQAEAQQNRVMVIILKILGSCIWCFEQCVKFLNKNAYIQVALVGTNFCTSAKNAFQLIIRNIVRFGVVCALSGIVHRIGFVFILVGTATIGYYIQITLHPDVVPVVPLLLYIGVGYLVSKLYMNVFGLAVDTCLQCLIATEEMKVNGDEFVPRLLQSFIDGEATKNPTGIVPG